MGSLPVRPDFPSVCSCADSFCLFWEGSSGEQSAGIPNVGYSQTSDSGDKCCVDKEVGLTVCWYPNKYTEKMDGKKNVTAYPKCHHS